MVAAARAAKGELAAKLNSMKKEAVKDWSELLSQAWSSRAFPPWGVVMVLVL